MRPRQSTRPAAPSRCSKATGSRVFPNEPSVDAALDSIERELDGWETEGMHVVSTLDVAYPVNLGAVHDRPALLFVKGRLEERDERSVAVVGTRKPTDEGLAPRAHTPRRW